MEGVTEVLLSKSDLLDDRRTVPPGVSSPGVSEEYPPGGVTSVPGAVLLFSTGTRLLTRGRSSTPEGGDTETVPVHSFDSEVPLFLLGRLVCPRRDVTRTSSL